MKQGNIPPFSIQSEIIRLIQTANGQETCYATPINGECSKMECTWRNDCLDEARGLFPPLRMRKPEIKRSFDIPAEIIKLLRTDDGQNA